MAKRYVPKEGYIQLWRRLRDHRFWPTYKRRKFTEFEAWCDLLFDATYKAHTMKFRGHTFHLKPGELVFAQNDRADRWKWSRGKVRDFLDSLYLNGEASHETVHGITQLTIHKLAGYAEWKPDNVPENDRGGKKGGKKGREDCELQDLSTTLSSNKVQEVVQWTLDRMGKGKKKGNEE